MLRNFNLKAAALVCLFALTACDEKTKPPSAIQPSKSIAYEDSKGMAHEARIYTIEPDEIKSLIREEYDFLPDQEVNYRNNQFDHISLPYIKERLRASGNTSSWRTVISKLAKPEGVGQPSKFKDSHHEKIETSASVNVAERKHDSLVLYPDTSLNAQEWIASWLNMDPSRIKEETGIDDVIMENFIKHHEDAHALGLNEPAADRYATLSVIKDHGVTDAVVNTLEFISDVRLVKPHARKYMACHDFIQGELKHIRGITRAIFIEGDGSYKGWEPYHPIKGMHLKRYHNFDLARHIHDEVFTKNIVDQVAKESDNKANATTSYLDVIAKRAAHFFAKFKEDGNDEMANGYSKFLSALNRLKSLDASDQKPSLYAVNKPVSQTYGQEFPTPHPGHPNYQYLCRLNEGAPVKIFVIPEGFSCSKPHP